MRSREAFYKNLVWIVNGEKFKSRFNVFIKNCLPDPGSKEFEDVVFMPSNTVHSCTMFWRKSENPKALTNSSNQMVRLHSARTLQVLTNKHYIGHHPFCWQRPHVAWLEAKCPIFFDFGSDILWRLEKYRDQFYCVRAVAKRKVIEDIIQKTYVQTIAGRHSILID